MDAAQVREMLHDLSCDSLRHNESCSGEVCLGIGFKAFRVVSETHIRMKIFWCLFGFDFAASSDFIQSHTVFAPRARREEIMWRHDSYDATA